jgi:GT2 family glycosyltransferase
MDLSVIIVNYNVRYFLEQCLHAVIKASSRIKAEIIVVDNNSVDGSPQMVAEKFPGVKLIANTDNRGFAAANNQAIKIASGRYILLLNPDTVIQEDTFLLCLAYMDEHVDAGSMGVKMIDGKGNYLPESKRSLPTPLVAFYKIFGLSALFPRSKRFGKYHLGYLDPNEIHQVDVLSGAFMMIRKSALEKTGLLDEEFFMYGEDIDLSYRIKKAGYYNVYFPKTTIIHYKGESTKKGSINYVLVFYRAMIIFARKHFSESTFRFYSLFIHLAIYFRAGLSIITRFLANAITPLLDAVSGFAGFALILPMWEQYYFGNKGYYPPEYLGFVVPAYLLIWLAGIFITTGYEKKVKIADLLRGLLGGSLIILLIYALLPENWRFSRAMILIGTLWMTISTILIRFLLYKLNGRIFSFEISKRKKRLIIIGEKQESKRVYTIIEQTQVMPVLIGYVNPGPDRLSQGYIGHVEQLNEIARINQADELIFCAASMSSQQIITAMLQCSESGIEFKIAPPESMSVIGSTSNDVAGELYVLHFSTLSRLLNKRKKRLFDAMLAFIFLGISPLLVFFVRHPAGLIKNITRVLFGFATWVGYYQSTGGDHPGLPRIRPGILSQADLVGHRITEREVIDQMNLSYAKDYRILNDIRIIFLNVRLLGREPENISQSKPQKLHGRL